MPLHILLGLCRVPQDAPNLLDSSGCVQKRFSHLFGLRGFLRQGGQLE